jgi:hypothetical protein
VAVFSIVVLVVLDVYSLYNLKVDSFDIDSLDVDVFVYLIL